MINKATSAHQRSRVLLVDDHPIVRQGLERLINQESDLMVCGEAESGEQALAKVEELTPDAVIVDLSLEDMSGLELIKQLRLRKSRMPIVVLSMHDEATYAERVLRAGAKGYVMKQEGTEKVISAVRKALQGEIAVSKEVAARMLSSLADGSADRGKSPVERLSDRELEVFELVGHGMSTREIAEKLVLSIKTVESYREHIKQKMKLKNAVELVRQAVRHVEKKSGQ